MLPHSPVRPALWILFCALLPDPAGAQTELFFTEYEFNNPKIKSIQLDGSSPTDLFTIPSNEWLPVGLAVDAASARVFWADSASPNNVLAANLDGSALQSLIAVSGSARGPALDGAGKVYYTAGNTVRRANVDGTGDELLFTAVQTFPLGAPFVDATNGHVYVGADHAIRRMDLDGSDVKTVVRGLSTPRAIELDVANGHVYWIDANTISDHVGRARLDDTELTVIVDASPGVVQSSGLIALLLDRANGALYFADDLCDTITKADLDGSGAATFYTSPGGLSPSGLALSTGAAPQAVADCNGNGVPDADDVALGSSGDCNDNGVPDECEVYDPCTPLAFLLNQGSNPGPASRTVGGPSPSPGSRFEVFQPFDVPAGGWTVGRLGLDGWTANLGDGTGFSATLLPDDGTGTFPDESAPIASRDLQFRFDPDGVNWTYATLDLALPAGRHWVRLTANDPLAYHGAVNAGGVGLGSISRSGLGNLFNAGPVALRLTEPICPQPALYCSANASSTGEPAKISVSGSQSLAANAFVLDSLDLPANQFGYFLMSATQGFVPLFGGSQGNLCLGAPQIRFSADVLNSGPTGAVSFSPDLNALPQGTVFQPGEAWNFQLWYRDQNPGVTSNTTRGVSVPFCI